MIWTQWKGHLQPINWFVHLSQLRSEFRKRPQCHWPHLEQRRITDTLPLRPQCGHELGRANQLLFFCLLLCPWLYFVWQTVHFTPVIRSTTTTVFFKAFGLTWMWLKSRWFRTSAEYGAFSLYYFECKYYIPQIYNVLVHESQSNPIPVEHLKQ